MIYADGFEERNSPYLKRMLIMLIEVEAAHFMPHASSFILTNQLALAAKGSGFLRDAPWTRPSFAKPNCLLGW
jgi:hypothetical protein